MKILSKRTAPVYKKLDSYDTEEEDEEETDSNNELSSDIPSVQHQFPDPDGASSSVNAPPDNYNVIYIIFVIQGIGMLLPYNFFITAKTYFDYKFTSDQSIQKKFENGFALAAMFPALISVFINIFLSSRLSRGIRVITGLMVMFTTFVATTALVKIDSQQWPGKFFAITIVCVVIINFSSGIYQGTLFGVAGIVGLRYTQAIMSGQAVAGIFAALADLFSKLANNTHKGEDDPTFSALIYFGLGASVIAITAITYIVLFKLPRMQFYFKRFQRHAKNDLKARKEVEHSKAIPAVPYWLIFKQISPLAFSVTVVFFVTLTLFPAVISGIDSVNKSNGSRWTNDLFSSLICFLVFNVGDWCGRVAAGSVQIVSDKSLWLPVLCISRVIFVPLFLFCNYDKSTLPLVFNHDFWPVIFNVFFSLSNGYLGSLCMMYGPKRVAVEYTETAGNMMSCFLTAGLTLGACASFGF